MSKCTNSLSPSAARSLSYPLLVLEPEVFHVSESGKERECRRRHSPRPQSDLYTSTGADENCNHGSRDNYHTNSWSA